MAYHSKVYRRQRGYYKHSYRQRRSRWRQWYSVSHEPNWQSTLLRYNREGDTKLGFECVHEMENGNGQCGGNVFHIEDGFGTHSCIVARVYPRCHRVKKKRKWKGVR